MKATRNKLLAAAVAAAALLTMTSANAWWGPPGGPGGPVAWGWDPHEAYLDEYGFFDPYGPSVSDINRMYRDNWYAARGYPVYRGVGPFGPSYSDVRRQYMRKLRRAWGYPY
jgi:hypothetical protein